MNKQLIYKERTETNDGNYEVRVQDTPDQDLKSGRIGETHPFAKYLGFDHFNTITGPLSAFLEVCETDVPEARYLSLLFRPNEENHWEAIDGRILIPKNIFSRKPENVSRAREHFPLTQIIDKIPQEIGFLFSDFQFDVPPEVITEQIERWRTFDIQDIKQATEAGVPSLS